MSLFPVCFQVFSVDHLTVATDGIVRALNRSGTTQVVALDIPKIFGGVWHAGLLHKLNSYGISGRVSILISLFLSNRRC